MHKVLIPFTTPFATDRDASQPVDLFALKENIRKWNKTGIGGYVVLGSTGERVHLDEREYVEVIEAARAEVPKDLLFIVGAGQQSTRGTVNEIRKAADAGADMVLVITPHFYRSAISQDTLLAFYRAVADQSPLPVLLYSMPALTGVKIEPDTIAQLSEHANIIGVKDSSADIDKLKSTVELCPPNFIVMTGNGTVFLSALKAGACGAILAVGCAVPDVCTTIFNLFKREEYEAAEKLQAKLTALAHAVTVKYGIAGLKVAMDECGYRGGDVRAPLMPISEDARAEIAQLIKEVQAEYATTPNTAPASMH